MTDHDARPDGEGHGQQRHRVRVNDRRRVRAEEAETPEAGAPAPSAPSAPDADRAAPPASLQPEAAPGAAAAELDAARAELAEYRDRIQRLSADFDNARKRMVKDQTHAIDRASERLVGQLLEVLDEFQLAMLHGEQAPEFEPYLKGFELVYAKLFDTLRAEGLERIEAEGRLFDPTLHEALIQTGHGDGDPVVSEVLRQGYTFKGRVLRPAGVKVHRGEG
jgi:molecular chaperone GrpE